MKIATECKGGSEIYLNKGYWTPPDAYADEVAGPYFKCYSPSGRCNGIHIVGIPRSYQLHEKVNSS